MISAIPSRLPANCSNSNKTGILKIFTVQLLSLLINHTNISTPEADLRADRVKTHQENALQVFLAGLKEPIGGNVRARQPKKLKEAFDACIEERNFQNRFGLHKSEPFRPSKPNPIVTSHIPPKPTLQNFPHPNQQPRFNARPPPPIPYRFNPPRFQQQQQRYYHPVQNHNERQHLPPRYFQNPFSHAPNIPQRNVFEPRPVQMPKPIPMEVDPSVRSKQMNYMNRPRAINYHEDTGAHEPLEHDYQYYEMSQQDAHQYEEQYEESNPYTKPIPTTSDTASESRIRPDQNNSEVAPDSDELNFHLTEESITMR